MPLISNITELIEYCKVEHYNQWAVSDAYNNISSAIVEGANNYLSLENSQEFVNHAETSVNEYSKLIVGAIGCHALGLTWHTRFQFYIHIIKNNIARGTLDIVSALANSTLNGVANILTSSNESVIITTDSVNNNLLCNDTTVSNLTIQGTLATSTVATTAAVTTAATTTAATTATTGTIVAATNATIATASSVNATQVALTTSAAAATITALVTYMVPIIFFIAFIVAAIILFNTFNVRVKISRLSKRKASGSSTQESNISEESVKEKEI